jgi:hypothetical protein
VPASVETPWFQHESKGTDCYIDVIFLTDRVPTGDEKHVASAYAVSFGGNAVTTAFCCGKLGLRRTCSPTSPMTARPHVSGHGGQVWDLDPHPEGQNVFAVVHHAE